MINLRLVLIALSVVSILGIAGYIYAKGYLSGKTADLVDEIKENEDARKSREKAEEAARNLDFKRELDSLRPTDR